MTLRVLLGCYCNLLHRKNRLENQSSPLPSVPSVLEPSKTLRESNVAMERTHLKRSSVRCELSITEFVRIFWAQNDLTLGLSHLTMSNNSMLNELRTTWLSVARFRNYTVFILSIPNMSEHIPTVGHEGSSCPWENLTISVMVWYCIYIYMGCGHHGNPNMGIWIIINPTHPLMGDGTYTELYAEYVRSLCFNVPFHINTSWCPPVVGL